MTPPIATTSTRHAAPAHDGAVRWFGRAREHASTLAGRRALPGLVPEWRRAIPALIAASLIAPSLGSFDRFSQLQIPSLNSARSTVTQNDLIRAAIADATIDLTRFDVDGIDTIAAFEPNAGQFADGVDHVLRQGNSTVAIGDGEVAIGLSSPVPAAAEAAVDGARRAAGAALNESISDQPGYAATLSFVGADPEVEATPSAIDGPPTNYFIGDDPQKWITGVQSAGAIEYTNMIGTTDIRFLAVDDGFRFDAQVEPGTDPESIAIDVTGAALAIGDNGDLNLTLGPGALLTYSAPIAFQEIDGERVGVDAAFILTDGDTFGFEVGEYDESLPLVIDPTLDLSTYIGGSGDDNLYDAALDASGNIVVVGGSESTNYPTAGGAYDTTSNSNSDIVVTKLAEDGATVIWSTYVGGSGFDEGRAVEVAADGSVYVVGYTDSADYPTTGGAYDTVKNGTNDAIVSKLSSDGTALDASTYLGGSSNDYAPRMTLDGDGDVIVGIDTTSTDFPTTGGAYDTVKEGGTTVNDPAIAKLNSTLTALTWATMLGGTGNDYLKDVDLDVTDQVYAIIETPDTGLTTSAGAYDSTHNGGPNDMWVGRLNSTGTTLGYGTYLGGTGDDIGSGALTAHAADRVYITSSATAGFPTTGNAAYPSANTSQDTAFVVLDPTQTGAAQLHHGTFLGGTNDGYGEGVAVDPLGRAFIVGDVGGSGLATGDAVDSTLGGGYDGMFSIINPADGSLDYFTYLGGSSSDVVRAVLVDAAGDAIVAGGTRSSDFTTTAGAYDTSYSGGSSDGFVVRYAGLGTTTAITVNSTGDAVDVAPGDGVCDTGGTNSEFDDECTLRAAIAEANASSVVDTIDFDVPTGDPNESAGVWTISPTAAFPTVTAAVTIDATTQPGFVTTPIIGLNGSLVASRGLELGFGSDGSTIAGLAIHSFGADGISVGTSDNVLRQNHIGTNSAGGTGLGNANVGIYFWNGSNNRVGGLTAPDGNLITGNDIGVALGSSADSGNSILGNSIHSNDTLGIDFNLDDVTANDLGDPDVGPNDLLNHPVITSAESVVSLTNIDFTLDVPAGDYRIEFFANAVGADGTGYGEGQTLAGTTSITHSGSGNEPFSATADAAAGEILAATATEDEGAGVYGSTSEFSQAYTSTAGSGAGSIVMVTGDGAFGLGQDSVYRTFFESLGYTVSAIDDSADQATFDSAATANNAMYLSSTIAFATSLRARDLDIGIVSAEVLQWAGLMYSGSSANSSFSTTQVEIVDNTSYITSPFPTGPLTVTSSPQSLAYWNSSSVALPAGAQVLGEHVGSPTRDAPTVFEAGSALASSNTAAERRVFLPFQNVTFSNLNSNGLSMIERSLTWAAGNEAPPAALDPVVLDSIQKGTATIADAASSSTVTIDAVDPAKAFLTFTIRGDNANPDNLAISGELTSTTTVDFSRFGSTGDVVVEWSVAEFASGVTVERGVTTMSSTTMDVPVTPVALDRSFVLAHSRAPGSTFSDNDFVRATLTSSTNLRLEASGTLARVAWQVVTYNDAMVQSGTVGLGAGASTGATGVPIAVDPDRSWLVYTTSSDFGTASNIGQKLLRGRLTDASTITFDRSSTGQVIWTSWFLVEFTDATTVQSGSEAFGSTDTTINSTIDAVDPARSIVVGGAHMIGGRSAYTADDNPGVGWFTAALTSPTNLSAQRAVTGSSTADLGWSVVTWPASCVTPTADSDGDGLYDCEEDANTDLDTDPATNPGPNTDGDSLANYLDSDDDGDTILTSIERADPNSDGDPRDARDADRDGQPDYLDVPTVRSTGVVATEQKISNLGGGLAATLDSTDEFGSSASAVGDLDGDGVIDMAVGTPHDDDGGTDRGAVYILLLNADGTVKTEQKISSLEGNFLTLLDDDDQFGQDIAGLGDLDGDGIPDLVVGAYGDDDGGSSSGAVYVLFMNPDGTVKAEQKISSLEGGLVGPIDSNTQIGYGVTGLGDVDGDGVNDMAIGAYFDSDGGSAAGALYVLFMNTDGTVRAEQKIGPGSGGLVGPVESGDFFGLALAGLGDVNGDGIGDLAASAYLDDDGGTQRGAVYILMLDTDGTVKAEQKISDTEGNLTEALANTDHFGRSAAGIGDIDRDGVPDVAVGATGDDDGGSAAGAAYVLFLNPDGTVRSEQKISDLVGGLAENLEASDTFGTAVAGLGDLDGDGTIGIAVGASRDDDGAAVAGAVYVLDLTALSCTVDSDGDGLWDCEEDADADLDRDPSTNPGPDTDGDTVPNHLDADDDGDTLVTAIENADPNNDGDPRDALDTDRDGQPDYLDVDIVGPSSTPIVDEQKISDLTGGLAVELDNDDDFGRSVVAVGDLDGDGVTDLVVGADGDDDGGSGRGAVYVLFMNPDGTVKAEQKISDTAGGFAATLDDGDHFGRATASVGDLDSDGVPDIVVGAESDDDGGSGRGAAYVLFMNPDGTVKGEQKISDTSGGLSATLDNGDGFGASASGIGDVDGDGVPDIAVSADGDDGAGSDRGAAYVLFMNPDGTVKGEQKISDTSGGLSATLDDFDYFGDSVSGVGDLDGDGVPDVVVSADTDDDGGNDRGAIYVLFLNTDGTVKTENKISDTAGGLGVTLSNGDNFGESVVGVGDANGDGVGDILVGVDGDSDGGADRGAVYLILLNTNGTVIAEQKISDTDGGLASALDDGDAFGRSVSGLGDLDGDGNLDLAVGAFNDDDGGADRGAVYILDLSPGPCTIDSDGDGLWNCEEDADTDGDNDPATNPGPNTDGDALPNYLDADDDGDTLPTAIEDADPNGDGDPRDALDSDWDGEPDYLDIEGGPSSTPVADEQKISDLFGGLTASLDDNDGFGQSTASIGDIDGDGITDLLVGAQGDDDGGSGYGAVYVLFLNSDGTVRAEQKISHTEGGLTGPLGANDLFGRDVAGVGDLDGDGIGDVAVGAIYDDDGGGGRGAVYVLLLNANGTVKAEQKISSTEGGLTGPLENNDYFGSSVAGVGDVDGDGTNDIIVGAHNDDDGGSNLGAAYVLFLNSDGSVRAEQKISSTEGGFAAPLDADDLFGSSVAGVGDVDDDGVGDVAVGALNDDDGGTNRGAVYVLFLDPDGTVRAEQKISSSTGGLTGPIDNNDFFGSSVAGAGDIDGDGIGDLAIGAPADDDGGGGRGAVYLLTLAADGTVRAEHKISSTAGGFAGPIDSSDAFGSSIASLGDLDGDGQLDLVVGVPGDDDDGPGRGAVHILDLAPDPCTVDADGDGLWDCEEDADTDLDGDPSTSPGPDTDGDTTPNYLDDDDDGDTLPTAAENADPNADGDPRDALDSDRDGQPDYLDTPTAFTVDVVNDEQKISDTQGDFTGVLDDGDEFGRTVEAIGDIDGDRIVDLAVGTWADDDGGTDRGAVHILFMNANGTVRTEQKISDTTGGLTASLDDSDQFGHSVASIGDLDGDGVNDIAVGAQRDDDGGGDRGAVHVLFLNTDGTVKAEQKISDTAGDLTGTLLDGDIFGTSVGSIGDLDDDGKPDLVVGAKLDDDGGTNRGAVYVLFLNTDGTVKAEQKISDATGGLAASLADNDRIGMSVGGLGDIDGDGIEDLIAGASTDDDGGSNRGAVYILRLNADGTVKGEQKLVGSDASFPATISNFDELGYAVDGIGDINGDGVPDAAIGARYNDLGGSDHGTVWITLLNADGTVSSVQPVTTASGGFGTALDDGDGFGSAVSGVGDLDGDGSIGLAIGATADDDGGAGRGAVYVLDLTAAPLTVNSTDDDGDSNVGDGVCDTGQFNSDTETECTLRAAIEEANQLSAIDRIRFGIPASDTGQTAGISTITPATALPEISSFATIDATTQAGYTVTPVVAVSGTLAPALTDGLRVGPLADGTTITGLSVIDFSDDGIELNSSADGAQLVANFVGVHPDGSAAGNGDEGIDANDANGVAIDANVVSGNTGFGVQTGGTNVVVTANLIGVAPDGSSPMGNAAGGVEISVGAVAGTIGGRGPGDGNTIAHNGGDGVTVLAPTQAPVVVGNTIRDNTGLGIDIDDDGVTPPDVADADGSRLNQPVLLAASESVGITTVDLAFDTFAGDYLIDYYANPSGADPSGYGEGEQLIATVPVTHNGGGTILLRHGVPGTGLTITATATSVVTPETSEFSNAVDGTAGANVVSDSSIRRSDTYGIGGAPSIVTGFAGNAIDFSGKDLLIGPGLDVTSNSLSLGAWVRLDAMTGDDAIISKRSASGFPIYELAIDGATSEAVATVRVGGAPVTARGGTVGLAAWHQLDAQWTGTELILYIDAAEVDRVAAVGALATDVTTEVSIGGRSDTTRTVNGIIDHISINHATPDANRIATHNANVTSTDFITVGNEQTNAPGAWTASTTQSRTGTYSLSAPETDPGESPAWAVARDIDEPGIVFESYWWLSQATQLDIAAGTRTGETLIDQYSATAVDTPFGWELRQPSGESTSVDASVTDTATTGSWVKVEMWTDQLGDSRLLVDGVEAIGWTPQGGSLASGSAGLLANLLPAGAEWYVDDARARKLVTPEPTTTLGPIVRN